tara:strand:- start:36851 stop:37051 length:201 start_codon:yes stop_codon:yes gene_type:complete
MNKMYKAYKAGGPVKKKKVDKAKITPKKKPYGASLGIKPKNLKGLKKDSKGNPRITLKKKKKPKKK